MQITALSFIAVKENCIHTTQILIKTKDTLYPFYQTIIIKKQIKFKSLKKLN